MREKTLSEMLPTHMGRPVRGMYWDLGRVRFHLGSGRLLVSSSKLC